MFSAALAALAVSQSLDAYAPPTPVLGSGIGGSTLAPGCLINLPKNEHHVALPCHWRAGLAQGKAYF
jgi:hypothetical protein